MDPRLHDSQLWVHPVQVDRMGHFLQCGFACSLAGVEQGE